MVGTQPRIVRLFKEALAGTAESVRGSARWRQRSLSRSFGPAFGLFSVAAAGVLRNFPRLFCATNEGNTSLNAFNTVLSRHERTTKQEQRRFQVGIAREGLHMGSPNRPQVELSKNSKVTKLQRVRNPLRAAARPCPRRVGGLECACADLV